MKSKDWKEELKRELVEKAFRPFEYFSGGGYVTEECEEVEEVVKIIEREIEEARKEEREKYFEELMSLYGFRAYDNEEHNSVVFESLELGEEEIAKERKRNEV